MAGARQCGKGIIKQPTSPASAEPNPRISISHNNVYGALREPSAGVWKGLAGSGAVVGAGAGAGAGAGLVLAEYW
ncbi:hypothetical protein IAQ61_008495 [Plenodomus lingam]|uniref:uncharacterized protein n=1 Tax=Leptosphaeria maculans TaxID=5022 RepID=UPI00331A0011|nr:hypothetical protein IAQ61_008495 [Plenodomus lingam]